MKPIHNKMIRMIAGILCCGLLSGCVTTDTEALYYNPGLHGHQAPTIHTYDLYMVRN